MKPFFIISLAFNLFFILAAILFTAFFWNIDISSKMGDTMGGTLGPLINIVAIYYIYNTYRDQKDALDIQRMSLQDDRQVARDQMSIAFHSEISISLKEVEQMFQSISYRLTMQLLDENGVPIVRTYIGRDALNTYVQLVNLQDFFTELFEKDQKFLTEIINVYTRLNLVASRKSELESILNTIHSLDLHCKLEAIILEYGVPVDNIFGNLTIFGEMFPPQGNGNAQNFSANTIMRLILPYQRISLALESYGLKRRRVEQVNNEQPEFNFNPQINLDEDLQAAIDWNLEFE